MAKRKITRLEKQRIRELHDNGLTNEEIAKSLGWDKILVDGADSVRKQLAVLKKKPTTVVKRERPVELNPKNSIEFMTRESRNEHLRLRLRLSPRYKSVVDKTFSLEEKELFEYEYFELIKSMDSLNEAEEQVFFTAIVEYVLVQRARSLKQEEENCLAETLQGKWVQGDPRYRMAVSEQWSDDEKVHGERYDSLMKALKLSRAQRLDKKSDSNRKTLMDIANQLSHTDAKNVVADEIAALDRKKTEELERLLKDGHLYGMFNLKIEEEQK